MPANLAPLRPGDQFSKLCGRGKLHPVGVVYIAALIVGLGTIALQLLLSGGDADADAADGEADSEAEADSSASAILPIFLSLRFWTFALLAFGMVGALLHYMRLASSGLTLALSSAMGLGVGLLASLSFRALQSSEMSSGGQERDAIGSQGRVLLPITPQKRGKVRLSIKGQLVDMLATTDEAELPPGSEVLVEEVRGSVVHVSRMPL